MKKTIFLQTLLLIFLSNQHVQNYATEIRDAFAGREWEFLQHEITKKRNEKRNCFSNKLKQFATGILPLLLGCIGYNIFSEAKPTLPNKPEYPPYDASALEKKLYKEKSIEYAEIKNKRWNIHKSNEGLAAVILILSFFGSALGISIGDRILYSNATFETYEEFIKSWPKNKPFTPESLHQSFDELYMLYQKYGALSEAYYRKYLAIKDIVSQALYNRFPPPVVIYNSTPVFYYY